MFIENSAPRKISKNLDAAADSLLVEIDADVLHGMAPFVETVGEHSTTRLPTDRILDGHDPTATLAGEKPSPHEALHWVWDQGRDEQWRGMRHGQVRSQGRQSTPAALPPQPRHRRVKRFGSGETRFAEIPSCLIRRLAKVHPGRSNSWR